MIKQLVMASCMAFLASGAIAQTETDVKVKSESESEAHSKSTNDGNAQSITFNSPGETTATIRNVPSVSGPHLTTSNDTCMGSSSGSFNVAGFGIGGGTTWVDVNCKMLKNSRELWNMGMKAAAMALMCSDFANREALELTGYVCPQTTLIKNEAKKVSDAKKVIEEEKYASIESDLVSTSK